MKVLNNKKGSALLWTILLTVIITILLGAVMTATYAYFNYTMYTVKRQQAYFTARSAISALVDEFSSEEDTDPAFLPDRNSTVTIPYSGGFEFPEEMGDAKATLTRDNKDQVEIEVTGLYAGEEYTMKSTVVKQPLYFAGIAIKNLSMGGNLVLGDNTDLYYNNTNTFDLTATNFTLKLKGSLVTKGDAKIKAGTVVAGHTFSEPVTFSDNKSVSKFSRKIWNSYEYVLSNTTIDVVDDTVGYESTLYNTFRNLTNYTIRYCNNTEATSNYFGFSGVFTDNAIMSFVTKLLGLDDFATDVKNSYMSLTKDSSDALAIKYIKLLSLSQEALNKFEEWKNSQSWLQNLVGSFSEAAFGKLFKNYGFRIFDVSYIEFTATDESNRADTVVPIVYLFADKGLTIRVKYGRNPANQSNLGQFVENVEDLVTGFINGIFDIHSGIAYVIVYMEPGSTIELGCTVGGRNANAKEKGDLVFAYSIYGGDNTTVILNDGVTVLGEIYCDNLQIKSGTAQIVYSNSNGSQIAKQKISEFWTVSYYSD